MNRPLVCALGVCHRDFELAQLWLRWATFLCGRPGAGGHKLLVVVARRLTEEQVVALSSCIPVGSPAWQQVAIQRCADELEDAYPKSASHLFLRTLEFAEQAFPGHAVCWCEADSVLLRDTWLTEITAEYQTCGKPNLGAIVGTNFPHQGGNSVYAADWRTRFPSIARVLDAPDYKLWGPGKGQPWDVYCRKETTPEMAVSRLWYHVWKEREIRTTRLKDIPKEAAIFHQDKTGGLIREIAAARYPEFMSQLRTSRRFYFMNGHPSRLHMRNVKVKFSFHEFRGGNHRSAVCSDELDDEQAAAIGAIVGTLGVREIDEAEFLKVTGRRAESLPTPKLRADAGAPPADSKWSHPSVFVMLGRYGDICNVLPMLKAEADAGRRPTLVVAKDFADILDGVSYADRIVWDGAYDQLENALRWLKRAHGIPAPVVCQVHRNPFDKGRLTDSYQKEVWRLAGRLEQFETRGELVFDRRNEEREAAQIARWKKPMILVGLSSMSSPLQSQGAIYRALVAKFADSHEVVNLATNVTAERIFDLIGLFDAADLLIAADTVHLHLARASKVTTIAIVNDGWRGSVVEHAFGKPLRYVNVTPAAVVKMAETALSLMPKPVPVGAESTLTTIVEQPWRGQDPVLVPMTPEKFVEMAKKEYATLYHAVDVGFVNDRVQRAMLTWDAVGLTPAHTTAYKRDAKTALGDPRSLPFLKDVLWQAIPTDARDRGDDIVVWTNADIALHSVAQTLIREHVGRYGAAAMRRTESNGKGHPGRDLFAFKVDWLHEHWDEIPDYVLGAPVFDLGLVALIRKFHGLPPLSLKSLKDDLHPADMPAGLALHESHEPAWGGAQNSPSEQHNKQLFREWAKKHCPEIQFTKGGNLK